MQKGSLHRYGMAAIPKNLDPSPHQIFFGRTILISWEAWEQIKREIMLGQGDKIYLRVEHGRQKNNICFTFLSISTELL